MAVSRYQAEQGQTVRLRVRFTRNDTLFDPDSITKVEIRQRTGPTDTVLVATIAAGSVVQEAQGIYYVDWAIPSTQEVGAYVDRWYFTVNPGDPEQSDDVSFVILQSGAFSSAPAYLSVDEVRARYLPDAALTDSEISVLIDEATEIIDKYCGQKFGSQALTLDLDGTGQCWIVAPYHVRSISSITVSDSCCPSSQENPDPDDFALKGRWIIHKSYLPWPYSGARDSHFVCGCGCCDIFTRGQKNVRIEGMFGLYENIPAPIKRAAGLLVMYGGEDDSRTTPMGYNYESESKEQHSYAKRATDLGGRVQLRGATGIPEVDSILNLYRQRAGRMTVI